MTSEDEAVTLEPRQTAKFVRAGDMRRTPLAKLSYEMVLNAATTAFPDMTDFKLKYKDDEDDLCLLTSVTFSDFAELYGTNKTVRLEVVDLSCHSPQPAATTNRKDTYAAGPTAVEAPWDSCGSLAQPISPPPLSPSPRQADSGAFLSMLMQGFLSGGDVGFLRGEMLAPMLANAAPMILQFMPMLGDKIDGMVAKKVPTERVLALLNALRDGMEPFPQFAEARTAVDSAIEAQGLTRISEVLEAFLLVLTRLPPGERQDIATVVLDGVAALIAQFWPSGKEDNTCRPPWQKGDSEAVVAVASAIGQLFAGSGCAAAAPAPATCGDGVEAHQARKKRASDRSRSRNRSGTSSSSRGSRSRTSRHRRSRRSHHSRNSSVSSNSSSTGGGSSSSSCGGGGGNSNNSRKSGGELRRQQRRQQRHGRIQGRKIRDLTRKAERQARKEATKAQKVVKKEAKKNKAHGKPAKTPSGTLTFEAQLQTLADLGLCDRELAEEMLAAHDGNLQAVVDQLLA
eukprot:NODE_4058_length_1942_cov_9.779614.p1 GENE.NODE_4058_length_1942_cov_9.779614~~NODE_4058_length_1942_cov_9.779614.p1  ORF type:complete len:512 (+),score=144.86 NODE_4058_length_1942_cov_9.779614:122-1657(+)